MTASKASLSQSKAAMAYKRQNFIRPGHIDINSGSGRVQAFYDRLQAVDATNPDKLKGAMAQKPAKRGEPAPVKMGTSRTVKL